MQRALTSTFVSTLSTIAKIWKQYNFPTIGNWLSKLRFTHTMEYHAAVKIMCKNYRGTL